MPQETPVDAGRPGELSEGWFIYTIKQLELGLRGPLERVTLEAGLTAAQFTALSVLSRWPGLTSSELARRSFVRAQTMAETLSPLLESGAIERRRDPGNRRRFLLFNTESGTGALASIRTRVSVLEAEFLRALTPEERDAFAGALRSCRMALEDLPR